VTVARQDEWQDARAPWDQIEGEPDRWYARFQVYMELGVMRTMKMAAKVAGEKTRGRPLALTGDWTYVAQRWYWRERAHAWDVRQRDLLALSERNTRMALHQRRVARMEDQMDEVSAVLDAAHLTEADEEQARKWMPQMRVFLRDLLVAERKEFERGDYERDDPEATLEITAEDLRAAQRQLEEKTGHTLSELVHNPELMPPPTRAAALQRRQGGTRTLSVCVGPDAELALEVATLREIRTDTSMDFMRVLNPTRAKLANHLWRERSLGRPVELLHLGLAVAEEGVLLADGPAGEAWVRKHLRDVRVLLLAGGGEEHVSAWLDFVPHVVSLDPGLGGEERVRLASAFWRNVGAGMEAPAAWEATLEQSDRGMEQMVQQNGCR
jgi:hypothetical protein